MSDVGVLSTPEALSIVRARLDKAGIAPLDVAATAFPEEIVILAKVPQATYQEAIELAGELDRELQRSGFQGFVTIRGVDTMHTKAEPLRAGVHDERVPRLMELLTTRSRTSEVQPSLSYVPDAAANASLITAARHHLVFGRRGAGKTALLLEGKRLAEERGALTTWLNIQTYRDATAQTVFLWVADQLLTELDARVRPDARASALLSVIGDLQRRVGSALQGKIQTKAIIPATQQLLSRFGTTTGSPIYVFLDDFHYLAREQQPELLDYLHRATRDTDVWLKVATIRHLTRWYDSALHVGLETGHDADHIQLDLTLQDPERAKAFLEEVLRRYAQQVGIAALSRVFSADALDRMVLASGAVPRDYLTLAARAAQRCRTRPNSKTIGVQDVNAAAGDAAKTKIDELEDDLSGNAKGRNRTLSGLNIVRAFCVDEKSYTYFRIDFRDREERPDEYGVLNELLDVRLLHLLEPSLSDPHHAGERSEVYMLDLSQFSGQRLKHYLRVLDFSGGHFVARETRRTSRRVAATTARKLNSILRAAPQLDLKRLESVD